MHNYSLTVSYDGTAYLGWQDNHQAQTIEEKLKKALATVLRKKILLQAGSRTDRGVHALAQVVNFKAQIEINTDKLGYRLNQLLPKDIRVLSVDKKPDSFHPSVDAKAKSYIYYIDQGKIQMPHYRRYSWHICDTLDINAMQDAGSMCIGKHDFSSFSNQTYSDPYRTIHEMSITIQNNLVILHIRANAFLYKMVRIMTGTLVHIGLGKIPVASIQDIIQKKQRKCAKITAPAHGLFLQKIFY